MLDARLFTPLPAAARRRIAADFVAFALARDGAPDLRARSLAHREAFFQQLRATPAPRWDGAPIDPAAFAHWHRGTRPLSDAPPLIAWLVKVARANEGEGWGVDYLLDRGGFDGLGTGGALQPRDFADLEETYHTRIMREIVALFGLDYALRTPPLAIRQSVQLMAHLPRQASYMLLLAGELMGTVAFARLAQQGETLLAGHPAVAARVRELLDEILVDEVGHVTFLLGSMRGWQLAVIRRLALLYAASSGRGYSNDAGDAAAMRDGIRHYSLAIMPERVLRRAFVPAPYWPHEYGAAQGGMSARRAGRPVARRRPGRPPGPSRASRLRARLVAEASHLYAEGGYAGLSFATVAARAGLTKPTVFHYFPTKDALLRAVFDALGERLQRAAETWFDPPPTSHAARLDQLVRALVEFYGRDPLNARILCHGLLEAERLAPWRPAGTPSAPVFDQFVRRFAQFLAAGAAAGEFHRDRPMAIIMAIGGIVLFELMLPEQGRQFRSDRSAPRRSRRAPRKWPRWSAARWCARSRRARRGAGRRGAEPSDREDPCPPSMPTVT
ncbi:MAG: TetR/AcrR family transcriptional regulator [Candidatus Binatia bacterium]